MCDDRAACAITDTRNGHLYLTAHSDYYNHYYYNKVSKYGPEGFLEELPDLNKRRVDCACAGYYNQDDRFVLLVIGGGESRGL